MKPVTVGRYTHHDLDPRFPEGYEHPSLGWIETEDWIVWEDRDGTLYVVNGRDANGNPYPGKLRRIERSVG